jgi:hypothetical protein
VAIATVVAAGAIAWLSLHDVPGAERYYEHGRRQCCHTTLVHDGRFSTMFLLFVPIAFVARRSLRLAPSVIVASSVMAFTVAHEVVHRYDVSGWGDGLEVFAYVEAAALTLLWVFAALIGAEARPGERSGAPVGEPI